MRIGYACLIAGVSGGAMKSCMAKNTSVEKLREIISHNLVSLENIIKYNVKTGIKLFRISSDLIPFGSSYINTVDWQKEYEEDFKRIGEKIKESGIRVSMHPGQYTVINSPDPGVRQRAFDDIKYHAMILDCLGTGKDSKIILHAGGVYGDKDSAVERFTAAYNSLDSLFKKRIVIENDDKSYSASDILKLSYKTEIPMVYDNLHSELKGLGGKSHIEWISEAAKTWSMDDGPQKIHYSQQAAGKTRGAHSETINAIEFINYIENIINKDIDIMLEVKDKNLSAVKCINYTARDRKINRLEAEWSRYKYTVLEKSPQIYDEIRSLLKDKNKYPVDRFYDLIGKAMGLAETSGYTVNAADHVWGYFKETAEDKEKAEFERRIEAYKNGNTSVNAIKKFLYGMLIKYGDNYLKDSYYFVL